MTAELSPSNADSEAEVVMIACRGSAIAVILQPKVALLCVVLESSSFNVVNNEGELQACEKNPQ